MKKKTKKVEGSPGVKEVLTDGLREARAGEKGKNRPNPDAKGQPNIVSGSTKNPYPNQKQVRKDKFGDITVTQMSDDKGLKRFVDEN